MFNDINTRCDLKGLMGIRNKKIFEPWKSDHFCEKNTTINVSKHTILDFKNQTSTKQNIELDSMLLRLRD